MLRSGQRGLAQGNELGRFACPNLLPYPGPVAKPKKSCCTSKPRCGRCPIRMLAEGRLEPDQAKKLFSKARNKKALKQAKLKKAKLDTAA